MALQRENSTPFELADLETARFGLAFAAQAPNPQHSNVTELKYFDKRWSKGGAYVAIVATTQVYPCEDKLSIR